MILSCPACSTQYRVADAAIGPAGRQVRCASCGNSWLQPAAPLELVRDTSIGVDPATAEPVRDEATDTGRSDPRSPVETRRKPARTWVLTVLIAIVVLGGAATALALFAPSELRARLGLPAPSTESALAVELARAPERRTLANGHELLAITGRIVNRSDRAQTVPAVLAELRNARGAVVYSWTIAAPNETLAPRERVEFDSAEIDIPPGAEELNLKLAPRR